MLLLFQKKLPVHGGSRLGLKTGDKVTLNDLLYGLMLCSGNDAAVALAEHVGGSVDGFSEMMNQKATQLNLKNTHFETPHGLDKDEHYTTPYELAVLTNYALSNKMFLQVVGTKLTSININGYSKSIHNSNELLGNLNGIYGVKTGFTNGANRCLVTACKRDNMDIICVVLGADTKSFRTKDSVKLIEYSFSNFTPTNISEISRIKFDEWKQNNMSASFKITKSTNEFTDFNLVKNDHENINDVVIPIKNTDIDKISTNITCSKELEAPIFKGTSVGLLTINLGDSVLYQCDILMDRDIPKKTFFEYFLDMLKRLEIKDFPFF